MVGGYNVGARVVTVVMRTRIETDLGEVGIQRLVQRLAVGIYVTMVDGVVWERRVALHLSSHSRGERARAID